ncbi:hypothetical protein Tco_0733377 [Tanacetum coccineum]
MVEKNFFDEVVFRCSRLKNRRANLELKLQHQKESFLNNRSFNNQNAPEILDFSKINEWQAKLDAKDASITNLRKHIESLKGKNMVAKDATPNNVKEHVDILWEIVKHARALRPLDSDLDSAYSHKTQDSNKPVLPSTGMKISTSASRSQPSGSTKTSRISPSTSSNLPNKVEDHPRSVKSNKNIKNRVIEPICDVNVTKPVCNVNVKYSMLNVNSELIYATCNEYMFDTIHDLCVLDYVNDVNVHSKSKSAKSRQKKKTWKHTGEIFTSRSHRPLILGLGMLKAYDRITLSAHQLCVDLLKESRDSNLYTLSLEDRMLSSPICLLSKVSKTKTRIKPSFSNTLYPPTKKDWDILFQLMFDEYFNLPPSVASLVPAVVALEPTDPTGTPSSTSIDQDASFPSTSQTPQESKSLVIPSGVEEEVHDIKVTHLDKDPFVGVPFP